MEGYKALLQEGGVGLGQPLVLSPLLQLSLRQELGDLDPHTSLVRRPCACVDGVWALRGGPEAAMVRFDRSAPTWGGGRHPGVLDGVLCPPQGSSHGPAGTPAGWHPGNERGGAGADELLLPRLLECVHRAG